MYILCSPLFKLYARFVQAPCFCLPRKLLAGGRAEEVVPVLQRRCSQCCRGGGASAAEGWCQCCRGVVPVLQSSDSTTLLVVLQLRWGAFEQHCDCRRHVHQHEHRTGHMARAVSVGCGVGRSVDSSFAVAELQACRWHCCIPTGM